MPNVSLGHGSKLSDLCSSYPMTSSLCTLWEQSSCDVMWAA